MFSLTLFYIKIIYIYYCIVQNLIIQGKKYVHVIRHYKLYYFIKA